MRQRIMLETIIYLLSNHYLFRLPHIETFLTGLLTKVKSDRLNSIFLALEEGRVP